MCEHATILYKGCGFLDLESPGTNAPCILKDSCVLFYGFCYFSATVANALSNKY
jgi:hypothetical protein